MRPTFNSFCSALALTFLLSAVGCSSDSGGAQDVAAQPDNSQEQDLAATDLITGDTEEDTASDNVAPDQTTEDQATPDLVETVDDAGGDTENDGDTSCAGLDCTATCATDEDCAPGHTCAFTHQGCCSECQPQCDICLLQAGDFCAVLPAPEGCEVGQIAVAELGTCWFEVTYTGVDGVDTVLQNGCDDNVVNLPVNGCSLEFRNETADFEVACNWCGEVLYQKEACSCQPDCEGKSCGPDGCGGECGTCQDGCTCTAEGQCAGCDQLIPLEPLCVHFPTVVPAGGMFPIAVFGIPGCTPFDDYEVTASGFDITVTLLGLSSADPSCEPLSGCTEEASRYLGLVMLDAPNPGSYKVTVGQHTGTVIASGGIIESPACIDDCPATDLASLDWTLAAFSQVAPADLCLQPSSADWLGLDADITGSCQEYLLGAIAALPSTPVFHCTDNRLLFGTDAPYWMEATLCNWSDAGSERVLLGVIQEDFAPGLLPAQAFLVKGSPVQ